MDERTPVTLLEKLRGSAVQDWQRFIDLYGPMVEGWLRRQGIRDQDAEDIWQEVIQIVVREMPKFSHNGRPGAFRNWLRKVTANRLHDFWRKDGQPVAPGGSFAGLASQLEDANSQLSRNWDAEHNRYILERLMDTISVDFKASSLIAFRRVVLEEHEVEVVASELGISSNAVRIAKWRVVERLKELGAGLID